MGRVRRGMRESFGIFASNSACLRVPWRPRWGPVPSRALLGPHLAPPVPPPKALRPMEDPRLDARCRGSWKGLGAVVGACVAGGEVVQAAVRPPARLMANFWTADTSSSPFIVDPCYLWCRACLKQENPPSGHKPTTNHQCRAPLWPCAKRLGK
jgi:hypothetical protein